MDYPWSKAAVLDTPFQLRVLPPNSLHNQNEVEGYGTCMSTEDVSYGRFLSTNGSISSTQFADMFSSCAERSILVDTV